MFCYGSAMRTAWLKTYKEDENIVMAKKLQDFSALGQSFFRRARGQVHGVMMPYQPLTQAEHEEVMEYARVKLRGDGKTYSNLIAIHVLDESLQEMLGPHPRGIDKILETMRVAFHAATGRPSGLEGFNINNFRPDEFHRHQATMTYTQNGLGTVGRNRQGGIYTAPAHHLFMMEDNFDHTAPDFMPCPDNPRITYIIG